MQSLRTKLIRVVWIIHFWLLKDMHFVGLEALTMLINNLINVFQMNLNIILDYAFSLNTLGYR